MKKWDVCAVYILTNKLHTVLYTWVTSNLTKRIYEHKNKINIDSFSSKYNTDILVYYDITDSISWAIEREKQIKAGSRRKKESLINSLNPSWDDLYTDLI